MYNSKFILSGGKEIYPGYLDKDKRAELREKFGDTKEFMWCGCKSTHKLYYKISQDLKIYPEHNNYEHDYYCSRFKTQTGENERKTGYVINEEDGTVTAFLTFNPKNLNLKEDVEKEVEEENSSIDTTEEQEEENELVIEKEKGTKMEVEKAPNLSLQSLIRSINVDTFTEKVLNDKRIDSKITFSKFVYWRMKKIRPSKMRKAIGELSLETDGVRFVYSPFAGVNVKEDKGLIKCYLQTIGKTGEIYSTLIFPDTLEKLKKEFAKMYGIEPNNDTMLGGFQYQKKSRSGFKYVVIGRVHLFQISELGIYCRNLLEKTTYDTLTKIVAENKNLKFWIPPEDNSIGGIIGIKGKEKKLLLLFRTQKDEVLTFDYSMYEPFVIGEDEPITKERLYESINQME